MMKELVQSIAEALVDQPELVEVKEVTGDRVTLFELHVGDGEVGKVIGKKGRTANAIRTILGSVSTKNGKRAELEIVE